MNNFMKKVIVALTSVLMVSSMVVSASAVSSTGATCTGNNVLSNIYNISTDTNSNECIPGIDVNSLLGKLSSNGCPITSDNTSTVNVAGTTSNCTNSTSVQSVKVADATDAANCNGGTCTTNANCNGSTCTTNASCNGSTCTSNASCNGSTCTTSGCVTGSNKCTILSGGGTSACTSNNTLRDRINNALTKCGLNIKKSGVSLPGSTNTATTPTPAPSAGTDTATTPPTDVTGTTDSGNIDNQSFEQQVLTLVNEQRAANGLAPLTLSSELSNVARTKSQDMHDNNYFSHTSPTYGSPFDMLKSFGITYRAAGENIAMGYATPEAVMSAWMNSAGHRANILNASYTQIGVGYVADGNYWTQEFIG